MLEFHYSLNEELEDAIRKIAIVELVLIKILGIDYFRKWLKNRDTNINQFDALNAQIARYPKYDEQKMIHCFADIFLKGRDQLLEYLPKFIIRSRMSEYWQDLDVKEKASFLQRHLASLDISTINNKYSFDLGDMHSHIIKVPDPFF